MENPQFIPPKIGSNFKPKLIWQHKGGPYQKEAVFLKTFPKYFSQTAFHCKSIQKNKVFSRSKHIKNVRSLIIIDQKPLNFESHRFLQSLVKTILHFYKHSID